MNRKEAIDFYRLHAPHPIHIDEAAETLIDETLKHQRDLRDEVDGQSPYQAVLTLQAIKQAAKGLQKLYGKTGKSDRPGK